MRALVVLVCLVAAVLADRKEHCTGDNRQTWCNNHGTGDYLE
eukprot:gene6462-2574_t